MWTHRNANAESTRNSGWIEDNDENEREENHGIGETSSNKFKRIPMQVEDALLCSAMSSLNLARLSGWRYQSLRI